MTIPSMLLFEELKQERFRVRPYKNLLGEVCIGYGHRLCEKSKLLYEFDRGLYFEIEEAKDKIALRKNGVYPKELIKRVMDSELTLSDTKARVLLQQDMIDIFDFLAANHFGFMHVLSGVVASTNAGLLLEKSQMKAFYDMLSFENEGGDLKEALRVREKYNVGSANDHARFMKKQAKHIERFSSSELAKSKTPYFYSFSQKGGNDVLGVYNEAFHNTHSASKSPVPKEEYSKDEPLKSSTALFEKQKRLREARALKYADLYEEQITRRVQSVQDSAHIRLDALVYIAHLIGVVRLCAMKKMGDALKKGDYEAAVAVMLASPLGHYFKEKWVVLARRLRYGLMLRSAFDIIPEVEDAWASENARQEMLEYEAREDLEEVEDF